MKELFLKTSVVLTIALVCIASNSFRISSANSKKESVTNSELPRKVGNEAQGIFYLSEISWGVYGPDYTTRRVYSGWRDTWKLIISGHFVGDRNTRRDLLFYDNVSGEGYFYTLDRDNNMTKARSYHNWSKNWSHIVSGDFLGYDSDYPNQRDDLFFYDKHTNRGYFYRVDGDANIRETLVLDAAQLGDYQWDIVVPFKAHVMSTCLLFYDKETGHAKFSYVSPEGVFLSYKNYTSWRRNWSIITPVQLQPTGRFDTGLKGLLFYEKEGTSYSNPNEGSYYIYQLTREGIGNHPVISKENISEDYDQIFSVNSRQNIRDHVVFYRMNNRNSYYMMVFGEDGHYEIGGEGDWRWHRRTGNDFYNSSEVSSRDWRNKTIIPIYQHEAGGYRYEIGGTSTDFLIYDKPY